METLFLYFAKTILCSGVMFLYYRLFLKDKTFHHYNRFYLLSILVVSLFLPLLKVSYFTLEVNSDIYLLINKLQNFNTTKTLDNDFIYFKLIALAFGLVSVVFLAKFFFGIFKIHQLKKNFKKENFEGINFYQTNLQEAPFSFFRNLFWKNSILINSDLGRQILKHEMVHIEQKHSRDKIFIEIITSIFWFNPFFYFIKKEINLSHDYLADKKAVKNSDTKAFAQMLLASQFSGKHLPATSPFLSSNLKKRLTMLKKSKTKYSYVRKILALPILFILAFVYMVNAKNKEIKETNLEISKLVSDFKSEITRDTVVTKNDIPEENQLNQNPVSATENPPIPTAPPIPPNVAFGTDGTEIYNKHPELFFDNDTINKEGLKKLQKIIGEKNKSVQPLKEILSSKNKEARKLSDEIRKKNDEFRKLSKNQDFDNPQYKKLESDMNDLSKKMDEIYNSAEFKKMESHYKEMDGLYAQLDKYYNSKQFKDEMRLSEERAKESEKMFNSPEYKKKIKDAEEMFKKSEERMKETERMFNSPEYQKRMKDAEKRIKEAEKRINSPEFKKRMKETEERLKEADKRLKEAEERMKIENASNVIFLKNPQNTMVLKNSEDKQRKVIVWNKEGNNKVYFNGNDLANSDIPDNATIYINGKLSTKEDLKKLDSKDIETLNINKNSNNGKETNEIKIRTRS